MNCFAIFCLTIAFPGQGAHAVNQTFDIDGTKNGSSGVITSPGYPGNYPNNVNYTWILRTGHPKATVYISILEFDIRFFSPPCDDYLQITETQHRRLALHRCGQFSPFNLTVEGEQIEISFVSDRDLDAKGFKLTWKVYIRETKAIPVSTTTATPTTPLMTTTEVTSTTKITTITPTTTSSPTKTTTPTRPSTHTTTTPRTTYTTKLSTIPTTSLHVQSSTWRCSPSVSLISNYPPGASAIQKEETTTTFGSSTEVSSRTEKNSALGVDQVCPI